MQWQQTTPRSTLPGQPRQRQSPQMNLSPVSNNGPPTQQFSAPTQQQPMPTPNGTNRVPSISNRGNLQHPAPTSSAPQQYSPLQQQQTQQQPQQPFYNTTPRTTPNATPRKKGNGMKPHQFVPDIIAAVIEKIEGAPITKVTTNTTCVFSAKLIIFRRKGNN